MGKNKCWSVLMGSLVGERRRSRVSVVQEREREKEVSMNDKGDQKCKK